MRRRFFIAYALLLLASWLFAALFPVREKPTSGQKLITVERPQGCERPTRPVEIAFAELGDASNSVVVLLHGSPVGASLLHRLAQRLSADFRVIVPDLPGFAASTRGLPDYSIAAGACYVRALLQTLHIHEVHIVGYSMGGGVAIHLAQGNPQSVKTLTLLSSIGEQESELTGNYHLNHLLHALQLGVIWLVEKALPHFGYFGLQPVNYEYARNFYDTDQRPLASYLSRLAPPVLILHGFDDWLVPVRAAERHHELIPHSLLRLFPGEGHLLPESQPGQIAAAIRQFVTTQADLLVRKNLVSAGQKSPLAMPWLLLILIPLATLVSEDLTCIGSGMLVAADRLGFPVAVLTCFAGIFFGDLLLVVLGRWARTTGCIRKILARIVAEDALHCAERWLQSRGQAAVIASRFLPGTRLPLYTAIGFASARPWRYAGAFAVASALWTPLLVGIAVLYGETAFSLLERYEGAATYAIAGIIVFYFMLHRIFLPVLSWKGRRLLYSRWLRLTRWEFWPPYIFYIPLGFYILCLMLRYRSMTVFTAANPAIPDGGFIGESKSAILSGLGQNGKTVARYALIAPTSIERRVHEAETFMRRYRLSFPVVLKPDVGERGNDVVIVKDRAALTGYFASHTGATIVQEYIPGREYGVFYIRLPEEQKGRIFATTDKRFPTLIGDGVSTLEELILSDDRALCMANFHLKKYAATLTQVIAKGEIFPLVELGTHCKGSLFLDGGHLITEELSQQIERVSRRFKGFFFGRYDIRVSDEESFMRGRGLKIVELNGVTSEATSIYDPRHSLRHAYRVLAEQWRFAFEIGRQNTLQGARPTPIWQFVKHLRQALG